MFDPERAVVEAFTSGALPVHPYPDVALRLNTLLARDDYSLEEVTKVLGADPSLAARVLGVANSAASRGNSQEITTLTQAVTRLGAAQLSRIALASGVADAACSDGALREIKFLVWRQSLTCAFVAQQLAPHRRLDGELAFLIGLLQGFGSTIVLSALEHVSRGKSELRKTQSGWMQIVARQQRAAAAYLARQWELPAAFASALVGEVASGDEASARLQEVVSLSRQIVSALERTPGLGKDELSGLLSEPAELDDLGELIPELPSVIAALAGANSEALAQAEKLILKSSSKREPDAQRLFSVVVHRARDKLAYQGSLADRNTLVLRGSNSLQENWLAKLELCCEPAPLDLWVRVIRSVDDGEQVFAEATPFALNGPALQRWNLLVAAATAPNQAS